jgi:hypothetical protein
VKIAPTERAKRESREVRNAVIYYSTAGGMLLITPSEALMKRAIDRQIASTQPSPKPGAIASTQPWLGDHFCAQFDTKGLTKVIASILDPSFGSEMQKQAWGNLPILNEWKHRFPDQDPVQLHERLWQTQLVDPAGGVYSWNDKLQTMESTIYGCPESPKPGPVLPPALDALQRANFGITFENQGLRAKAELYRAPAK